MIFREYYKQRLKGDAALVETSMERFERLTGVILAAARSARRDAWSPSGRCHGYNHLGV